MHYHTCSHNATTYCGFTKLFAKSKAARCATCTKHNCPHGLHACQLCGKSGHGAESCHTRSQQQLMPPADQSPARPAPPESSSCAVFVPGFGCKGEGKDANYGVAVHPPSVASAHEFPSGLQQPSNSSRAQTTEAPPVPSLIPNPIAATSDGVEEWINESFKPLTNIITKLSPNIGGSILWRVLTRGLVDSYPPRQSISMQRFATRRSILMGSVGAMLIDLQ